MAIVIERSYAFSLKEGEVTIIIPEKLSAESCELLSEFLETLVTSLKAQWQFMHKVVPDEPNK